MKNKQTNSFNNFEEDSIDIVALIKNIWSGRKLIIKITLSFFIIGCIVAVLSPVLYTSQTVFVPQVSDEEISSSKSRLGSLASLAGIDLNSSNQSTSDSYISPLLYSKIVDSEEFSLNLLAEELINLNAEKFTIKDYLLSKESSFNFNPIGFIKKYTVDLFLNNESKITNTNVLKNYNFINELDYYLISTFRQKFSIVLNEQEGYIQVLATDQNAFISSQLVEKITTNLQSKIIELRTNKINERLQYSKLQYESKQLEFDFLQNKLAEFKDSNKSISTARFMSELKKLESEYQLQESILINLASEYNKNKIKLNKDTPIFSVLDEVSVPNIKSAPDRGILVITYVFIGFVLSICFVVSKQPITDLIKKIKD